MRIFRPAFIALVGLSLSLSVVGCGGGDTGGGGGTTVPPAPTPDTSGSTTGTTDATPDAGTGEEDIEDASVEEVSIPPAEEASVKYHGLGAVDSAGNFTFLEYADGLFCGRPNLQIVVKAKGIGDRELRLYVDTRFDSDGNGSLDDVTVQLPIAAVPLTGDNITETDLFAFPLNADALIRPAEGSEEVPTEEQIIVPGERFDLRVEAWEPNEDGTAFTAPTSDTLSDEVKLKTDVVPPGLTLDTPDPSFALPTLSGFTTFEGRLSDAEHVSHITVTWGGLDEGETPKVLATRFAEDGESKQLEFEIDADLRYEASEYDKLTVTGYDACGLSTSIEMNAYILAWPWIRSYPNFELPDNQVINDTIAAQWDDDAYPDVLIATEKGIFVAINKGGYPALDSDDFTPAAMKVGFSHFVQLSSGRASAIDLVDIDEDGDQDIVAVARIETSGSALAIYRNRGTPEGAAVGTRDAVPRLSAIPEEYYQLPIANSTKVVGVAVADFDADGLVDVVIGTDSQEETLVLFKRLAPGGELGGLECTAPELGEPTATQTECDAEAKAIKDAGGADVVLTPACGGGCVESTVGDDQCDADFNCRAYDFDAGDCCPTLFAGDAAFAGGIDGMSQFEVADLTEVGSADDDMVEGEGDGYPDIIASAEGANQVWVFPNRFSQTGLLDTAFTTPEGSWVWPVAGGDQDTEFFCLGDMVRAAAIDSQGAGDDAFADENDFTDIIVGTLGTTGGTFRTLVGKGDGTFYNEPPLSGPYSGLDILSMAGTVGSAVTGFVCADFDQDPEGNTDFLAISTGTRLVQVHLGNGQGRYNQVGSSPLLNPANEGIGFAIDAQARRPRVADFNLDGYPDVLLDFRNSVFSVLTNLTFQGEGFDLDATRALVTPLGKTSQAPGGNLTTMAVGDITGDSIPDVVAMTASGTFKASPWIQRHPIASGYRDFLCAGGYCDGSDANADSLCMSGQCLESLNLCTGSLTPCTKSKESSTIYIWSSEMGSHGEFAPSYPASYDRVPSDLFGEAVSNFTWTEPRSLKLVDISGSSDVFNVEPDGKLDLMFAGATKGAKPDSNLTALINIASTSFWDEDLIRDSFAATFAPFNGGEEAFKSPNAFAFFTPPGQQIPGIVVPTNGGNNGFCGELSPWLQFCPWHENRSEMVGDAQVYKPYWECWEPYYCDEQTGMKFGGNASEVIKLSVEEDTLGQQSNDPMAPGDILVVSAGGDNLTLFRYNPELSDGNNEVSGFWGPGWDPMWYWDEPLNLAVGLNPQDVAVANIDGEGLPDIAATVNKNVMIAYGDVDNPYESFLPIDKRPGFLQEGGVDSVALADMNDDSFLDVVFTERSQARLTVYLAVGTDPSAEANGETPSYKRQYHGPIYIPVCKTPTSLEMVDFDGDGLCLTPVVLCEGSGAVALMDNETCQNKLSAASDSAE